MHVLVVTTVHVPTDARIAHRQIRSLLAAGHRVTYAAAFTDRQSVPPPGVVPVDLPAARGRNRLRSLVAARRLLLAPPPGVDLVLLHDPELLLAAARCPPALPIVWDVHEDLGAALDDKTWLPKPMRRLTAAGVRVLEDLAEERCHLLLAEEAYAARFAMDHPVVLNLPWQRPRSVAELRPQAMYVGRVSHGRGALDLIEVGMRLRAHGVELVVAGHADADVRQQVVEADRRGHLRWHGYLPNAEALSLLDGALAGLSLLHDKPNYRHSMPTKLLEYMERGLPVVTTPLPLARRLVEQHDCGVLVPFADPAAAALAILNLRTDAGSRAAMADRARTAAVAHYTWDSKEMEFVAHLERWVAKAGKLNQHKATRTVFRIGKSRSGDKPTSA